MRQLAERADEISTLSPADVAAATEAFLTIVPDELADGNIVSLGDFAAADRRFCTTRCPGPKPAFAKVDLSTLQS